MGSLTITPGHTVVVVVCARERTGGGGVVRGGRGGGVGGVEIATSRCSTGAVVVVGGDSCGVGSGWNR